MKASFDPVPLVWSSPGESSQNGQCLVTFLGACAVEDPSKQAFVLVEGFRNPLLAEEIRLQRIEMMSGVSAKALVKIAEQVQNRSVVMR